MCPESIDLYSTDACNWILQVAWACLTMWNSLNASLQYTIWPSILPETTPCWIHSMGSWISCAALVLEPWWIDPKSARNCISIAPGGQSVVSACNWWQNMSIQAHRACLLVYCCYHNLSLIDLLLLYCIWLAVCHLFMKHNGACWIALTVSLWECVHKASCLKCGTGALKSWRMASDPTSAQKWINILLLGWL